MPSIIHHIWPKVGRNINFFHMEANDRLCLKRLPSLFWDSWSRVTALLISAFLTFVNGSGESRPLGIGVIGFGQFAQFAIQNFLQVEGVELRAMAGTHREAAYLATQRFHIDEPMEIDALLDREDVDLVYISTPPFLHLEQSMKALSAGKHVICEKPLTLGKEDAVALTDLAKSSGLCCIANMMQPYNPLAAQIQALIDRRILGEPLFARFENLASDESLGLDHWFWDMKKSGGIFLEHGVHFFDLFERWLGHGKITSAGRSLRPGSEIEEQVYCTGKFNGVPVSFMHTFTQPSRMDRQEFRLVFERGDIVLEEWVPIRMRLHAVADEPTAKSLSDLFPKSRIDSDYLYGGSHRQVSSRHKNYEASQMIRITLGEGTPKYNVYGACLRHLMADQKAWISNPDHGRLLTEDHGVRSVALAEEASFLSGAMAQA
jgi:predicted dehydrogenase